MAKGCSQGIDRVVTERQPTGLWYFPDRDDKLMVSRLCLQYESYRLFLFRDSNINFSYSTVPIESPEHVLLSNLELIHWGSDDATST